MTAVYTPTGSAYLTSTGTYSETVSQATTSVSLIVTPNKPAAGGDVTITAVILADPPASGDVTGEVSFQVNGKHTVPLTCIGLTSNIADLSGGTQRATCVLSSVPAADSPLRVTVSYYGDANNLGSTKVRRIKLH